MKLIPAQFVKPFVKSNKNDFIDAEAIAEAVDRQSGTIRTRTGSPPPPANLAASRVPRKPFTINERQAE